MTRTASLLAAILIAAAALTAPAPVRGQAVTDQWNSAVMPEAPELKAVTLDPKTTGLIVMDFTKTGCTQQNRPRCVIDLPHIAKLIDSARERGVYVVYTQVGNLTRDDFAPDIAPRPNEPVLLHTVIDKFYGTDLEQSLKAKGITTVIEVGTSANGAELGTVSAAAVRGFKVVVPVDGIPGPSPFTEAYTVWHVTHSPVIADQVTLTKVDMIQFR